MTHPTRKSTSRRMVLAAAFLVSMAVSLSALAYWPWETVSVTSYYDTNGALVGVEAVGACGFPLIGETSDRPDPEMYLCSEIDNIPLPF